MGSYLLSELKRTIYYLPKILLVGLVVVGIIAGVLFGASRVLEDSRGVRLPIAISMPDDAGDGMSSMIFSTFENMEMASVSLDVQYVDEDSAVEAVRSGNAVAAIVIPKGFVQDIINGTNTPADIMLNDADISAALFRQTAQAGGLMLKTSQCGVYAVYDAAQKYGVDAAQLDTVLNEVNLAFINLALEQPDAVASEETGATGSLGTGEFVAASGIVLFLLLMGMAFTGITARDSGGMYRCLYRKGIGSVGIAGAKACGTLLGMTVFAAVIFVILNMALNLGLGLESFVFLLPVVVAISLFQIFMTYVVDSVVASILLQFIVGIVLLFGAGGILPGVFLPDVFTRVSAWLPISPMLEQARSAIAGTQPGIPGCALWSAVFFVSSALLIDRKIRKV